MFGLRSDGPDRRKHDRGGLIGMSGTEFSDVYGADSSPAVTIGLMPPVSTAQGARETRLYGSGNR